MNRSKIKMLPTSKKKEHPVKKNRKNAKNIVYIPKPKRPKNVKITTSPKSNESILSNSRSNRLYQWTNIMEKKPAFILGNSPSISSLNLKLLDGYFTIGINRIFYLYDPTILMWQDQQIWITEKNSIQKQRAIKICSNTSDPKRLFFNFKVFDYPYRFSMNPGELFGRGNTGILAVEFAVALGCSSIVMLGMDCKYEKGGKTDFYGKNKDHKPYTLKMCRGAMEWVKENCPIPIYNCGNIDLWRKQSLEEIINILKPEKLNREEYIKLFMEKIL